MSYILVIEDDCYIANTLEVYLEMKGIKVFCYFKYDEIKKCLEENGPPKLFLLDYLLYDTIILNTSEIIGLLKQCDIPIILMTALNNGKQILEHYGLNYLLSKPFSLSELDEVLEMYYKS